METKSNFDVIIIGGSYSGLAAGMALGRALRKVLIIDSGNPCNRQTPHSHNFLTQDGNTPKAISTMARQQVKKYKTVKFLKGVAVSAQKNDTGFTIGTNTKVFSGRKLIFATGIHDIMVDVPGFSACWGISVLHCPYCHGYEVSNQKTGILNNGDAGYEFTTVIANWTNDLTLYTNGKSTISEEQVAKFNKNNIRIVEQEIVELEQKKGKLQKMVFKDGSKSSISVLYAPRTFVQHCELPGKLGCELTTEGYLKVDAFQKTSIKGIFASGDCTTRMRTVANAVATGTTAGMMANRELIDEDF